MTALLTVCVLVALCLMQALALIAPYFGARMPV